MSKHQRLQLLVRVLLIAALGLASSACCFHGFDFGHFHGRGHGHGGGHGGGHYHVVRHCR